MFWELKPQISFLFYRFLHLLRCVYIVWATFPCPPRFLPFFCGVGDGTHGVVHRQVLYH
jgi:hypothetical protein